MASSLPAASTPVRSRIVSFEVRFRLLPLFFLLSISPARAACVLPDLDHPPTGEAEIRAMLANEERCRKDADYQFAVGQALNTRQRYAEAAERLELALLLRPDHLPTRLEFSCALTGTGDIVAARALIAELKATPDLLPDVFARLENVASPAFPLPIHFQRSNLTLSGGHDSNLLSSPVIRGMELTLPGGRVPVTLSKENRPREGHFWRLDAHHQRWLDSPGTDRLWYLALTGSLRGTPGDREARYGAVETRIENTPLQHGAYTRLSYLTAFNQDGNFYRQPAGEIGWNFSRAPESDHLRLGFELQQRRYPDNTLLNARYQGGRFRYFASDWWAEMRLGREIASNRERAGGDQHRANLLLGRVFRYGPHQLRLDYEYESIHDQQGYSPLLENDRKRRTRKSFYRAEYLQRHQNTDFFIGTEITRQEANLPLFVTRTNMVYLGVRQNW